MALKWSPELSMGVKLIDDQHKTLIALANDLISSVGQKKSPEDIKRVVKKLREYTVFHFNSEEELMEQHHFLKRGTHAREHTRLKDQVKQYQRTLYEKRDIHPDAVTDFLKIWLLKHILEYDREFANFLHAQKKS